MAIRYWVAIFFCPVLQDFFVVQVVTLKCGVTDNKIMPALTDPCAGRAVVIDPAFGTLTRASYQGLTTEMFQTNEMLEVGMYQVYANAKMARMAGVTENTLEMLLTSRLTPLKGAIQKTKIQGSRSQVLPYFPMRQKRNINSNWFQVTAGAAAVGAGTGGVHTGAWTITVGKHTGQFATDLQHLERYFLPGKYLVVEWYTAGNVSRRAQFKVISAANADAGGVNKATVTLEPSISNAGWGAADQTLYKPTFGVCYNLANSVSDYESWCYNEVAENTLKMLIFWLQTTRYTHRWDDEYAKVLANSLQNNYFRDFRLLPLAEQKRIQYQKYLRDWYNSVFYGDKINENQTESNYRLLPTVVDPANTSSVLEFKANALGLYPQLLACNRVYDHQGNALDLNRLFESGYIRRRNIMSDGSACDCVDYITDRWTADAILVKMIPFLKTHYSYDITKYIEMSNTIDLTRSVPIPYYRIQLPSNLGGYTLGICWHEFFDDRLTSFAASTSGAPPTGNLANVGRSLYGIDWTDFKIGVAATNSATRQTNMADNLYNCVIEANANHYQLESITWTTILEDPNRHEIVTNFSEAPPTLV